MRGEFRLSLKPFEFEVAMQKGTAWFYVDIGTYHETKDKRVAFDLFYKGEGKSMEKFLINVLCLMKNGSLYL